MSFLFKYILAPQGRKPTHGLSGYLARKLFELGNREIIEETVAAVDPKPNDNVLELGFGFGIGLTKVLDNGLRSGGGHLFGVDHSSAACDYVKEILKDDITSKKLTILNESVSKMSITDSSIDKIFHINCFYFWDDIGSAATEIFRVSKPGGLVVTGMNLVNVKSGVEKGLLTELQVNPQRYIDALNIAGFVGVRQDSGEEDTKHILKIFATKPI